MKIAMVLPLVSMMSLVFSSPLLASSSQPDATTLEQYRARLADEIPAGAIKDEFVQCNANVASAFSKMMKFSSKLTYGHPISKTMEGKNDKGNVCHVAISGVEWASIFVNHPHPSFDQLGEWASGAIEGYSIDLSPGLYANSKGGVDIGHKVVKCEVSENSIQMVVDFTLHNSQRNGLSVEKFDKDTYRFTTSRIFYRLGIPVGKGTETCLVPVSEMTRSHEY